MVYYNVKNSGLGAKNSQILLTLRKLESLVMQNTSNPFNLHTITPYLVVNDVPKLILFLETVFEGKPRGPLHKREDGSVQHAEISIGDSVLMLGEPMDNIKPMTSGFYIYVDNCDHTYKIALEAGGVSVSEPMNYPHGDRYGGVRDFAGNIWWMVTHIGNS